MTGMEALAEGLVGTLGVRYGTVRVGIAAGDPISLSVYHKVRPGEVFQMKEPVYAAARQFAKDLAADAGMSEEDGSVHLSVHQGKVAEIGIERLWGFDWESPL